ncbi:MAG: cobyrinate a,c-diamide synthase [Nitrospirota bacterium]
MTQLNHLIPRIVIAGLRGGSGKTIVSLGLIASFKRGNLTIVPFKKGPDYIDAGWLSYAAGKPCYNLDPFLTGKDKILSSFRKHALGAHCALIEGNRGLFDGMDSDGTYSTAELAKLLKAPVVLIIDCTKMTRTAAIIATGIHRFDPRLEIKGVILNQIANKRHEKVIRESFEKYCKLPVLGALPKISEEFFPERHMGLTPYHEHRKVENSISAIEEIAGKYLNLEKIWKIVNEAPPLEFLNETHKDWRIQVAKRSSKLESLNPRILEPFSERVRPVIGVIKDSAFQFYYPENFEELQKRGVELKEISALKAKRLPQIDALYIGGGFPETHAIALSDNIEFLNNLKEAVEKGLPVYAECGGLMFLGESLVLHSRTYPMAGVFPLKFCLEKKPQAHGYTIFEVERTNPYYSVGTVLKGHEFHYSRVLNSDVASRIGTGDDFYFAFKMKRGLGIFEKMDGLCYKSVLATYTHLHSLGAEEWADGLVNMAKSYKLNESPMIRVDLD